MAITILNTTKLTSSHTIGSSYANITGMDKNLEVEGTSSVILFHANITIDQGSDAEVKFGLFIDNVLEVEAICFNDANDKELGNASPAFWVTGLSAGFHDFDVRASDHGQSGAVVDVDHQRTSQVIEFTGDDAPTIVDEILDLTSSQTSTGSYVDIASMARTGVSIIGGSTSLVIVSQSVSYDSGSPDSSVFTGLFVDDTLEAESQCYQDNTNEGNSGSYMYALKGLTAGTHDFDLRMKHGQSTGRLDTEIKRHMQIVEFTNNPTFTQVNKNTTADTTATQSFTRINDMIITRTITSGDFVLVTSSVSYDADASDSGPSTAINIGGSMETEAGGGVDSNSNEPHACGLSFMKEGLSGSTDFELMFAETGFLGIIIATDTFKHLQVIEFTPSTGGAFERTASQTITESDTIARIQGHIRAPTQTITESDAVVRLIAFSRTGTTVLTHSEVIVRIQGHVRTAAQTLTHITSVLREGSTFTRTAAQTITESDIVTRIQAHIRTATQTLTHSESIARIQGHIRTATQTLTESDSVVRIAGFLRTATQLITESDTVVRVQGHVRTATQTITESDTATRIFGVLRTATQTITESDTVARIQAHIRTATQLLTHSESIARIQAHIRTVTQTITESDVAVRIFGVARTATQTITESDSVARIQGHIRTFSQTLTHIDSILREGSIFQRTATQIITESDIVVRIQEHIRTASQTLTHIDTIVRLGVFARTATQTLTHSEVITRIQGHIRTASQTLTHSSSVVATKSEDLIRTFSQTLTHIDSVVRQGVFARIVTQTLTHSEDIVRVLGVPTVKPAGGGRVFRQKLRKKRKVITIFLVYAKLREYIEYSSLARLRTQELFNADAKISLYEVYRAESSLRIEESFNVNSKILKIEESYGVRTKLDLHKIQRLFNRLDYI